MVLFTVDTLEGVYFSMKKIVSACLILSLILGLCACGAKTPAATEPAFAVPELPNKLEVKDVTEFPVATQDMSKTQLRQLILDFFKLQLSFQWTSNLDITDYDMTNLKSDIPKFIMAGSVMGGVPYQSLGTGNMYRWLEYYDETTGVTDLKRAFEENGGYGEGAAIFDEKYDADGNLTYKKYRAMQVMFNQCSSSSTWAWQRVINSARFGWSWDITAARGFVPVGCFDYGYDYEGVHYGIPEIISFKKTEDLPKAYTTSDVVSDMTRNVGYYAIYECYAQAKPGDILVRNGHVMMVDTVETVYTKSGKIDPTQSKMLVHEQIEGWAMQSTLDGVIHQTQGRMNAGYKFDQLSKEGYLPFTCVELLDPNDPQDKKHLDYYYTYADKISGNKTSYSAFEMPADATGAEVEKARTLCTYEGSTITAADFEKMVIGANYCISDVFVTVTDPSGKVLLKNTHRTSTLYDREVAMSAGVATWTLDESGNPLPISTGVAELCDGQNTVTVTVQVSTGDLLTAYTGKLTK